MSATATAPSSASGKKNRTAAKKSAPAKPAKRQQRLNSAEATKISNKRWDGRFESDEAVKEFFLNCEHGDGLEALTTLRRHVDIASKSYNANVTAHDEQRCGNPKCNKKVGPGAPWYQRTPVKDPLTQQTRNVFSCSLACYVEIFGSSGNPQAAKR